VLVYSCIWLPWIVLAYHSLILLQALVLAPTRELARQIHTVILAMGDYLEVEAYLVVGGESVRDMIRRLNTGVHVVVGM